jgi:hypothetical protein
MIKKYFETIFYLLGTQLLNNGMCFFCDSSTAPEALCPVSGSVWR